MPKKQDIPLTKATDRALPSNLNAEACVLSAVMVDESCVSTVVERINEEDFYKTASKYIYRAIVYLYRQAKQVDPVTVQAVLKRKQVYEKCKDWFGEIQGFVVTAAHLESHIQLVKETSDLRKLVIAANGIIESCYLSENPVKNIVSNAISSVQAIGMESIRKTLTPISDIIPKANNMIETIAASKGEDIKVFSGYESIDNILGGFKAGRLYIIAGRPAMGKSCLMLEIAQRMAIRYRKKVGIFTMEMENHELVFRMYSSEQNIPGRAFEHGGQELIYNIKKVTIAAEILSNATIFLDDSEENSVLDIKTKCQKIIQDAGLDIIFIDYLQLMKPSKYKDNRQQEISDISRELKGLAKQLNIPIVALSQLSRELEKRENKRPILSDLRESGALEQNADTVMFVFRDEYYTKDKCTCPGIAEIIIAKNRHGATDTAKLQFVPEYTQFREIEEQGEIGL